MPAYLAYFFGGGSVKYAKILCGSVNLVVFFSCGRAQRSAYFLAQKPRSHVISGLGVRRSVMRLKGIGYRNQAMRGNMFKTPQKMQLKIHMVKRYAFYEQYTRKATRNDSPRWDGGEVRSRSNKYFLPPPTTSSCVVLFA